MQLLACKFVRCDEMSGNQLAFRKNVIFLDLDVEINYNKKDKFKSLTGIFSC